MKRIMAGMFLIASSSAFGMEIDAQNSITNEQKRVQIGKEIEQFILHKFPSNKDKNRFIYDEDSQDNERTLRLNDLRKMVKQYNSLCFLPAQQIASESVVMNDEYTLELALEFPESFFDKP
jgi:hypothetical protein